MQTIADYFEGSKIKDGVKTCSKARSDAVTLGGLDGGENDVPLLFYGPDRKVIVPLRTLFKTMFAWFQARYKVLYHEKRAVSTAGSGDVALPPARRLRTESAVKPAYKNPELLIMDDGPIKEPPSAAIRALAAHLNDHKDALCVFDMLLESHDEWPAEEELRDFTNPAKPPRDPLPRPETKYSGLATISGMPQDSTASSDVSSKVVPAILFRHPSHVTITREPTLSGQIRKLGI